MKRNTIFILYLILGIYLINMAFNFISLGGIIGSKIYGFLNQGALLIGSIVIIIEAFRNLRRY